MGLDMYLESEQFIFGKEAKATVEITNSDGEKEMREFDVTGGKIVTKVGYWRKANAIHKWFVDNVQDGEDDCERYYVSFESLKELKELCEEVLENPKKAKELLPPCEGFFFGSTEVGDDYFQDLHDTIKIINNALENEDGDIYYQASW